MSGDVRGAYPPDCHYCGEEESDLFQSVAYTSNDPVMICKACDDSRPRLVTLDHEALFFRALEESSPLIIVAFEGAEFIPHHRNYPGCTFNEYISRRDNDIFVPEGYNYWCSLFSDSTGLSRDFYYPEGVHTEGDIVNILAEPGLCQSQEVVYPHEHGQFGLFHTLLNDTVLDWARSVLEGQGIVVDDALSCNL